MNSICGYFSRVVAVATLLVSLPFAALSNTTSTLPNIVWISCEDHGPDMPFYDDPHSHMPNLTAFAESGCVFDRAFATSPVCAPSRSTIITGVYAATLGTHNMRTNVPLPAHVKTFPTYLRNAGYYCTNNVKTDYNFQVPDGTWDENSRRAHWRNRPDQDQPFFAVFNLTVTHESKFKINDARFDQTVADVKPEHRVNPDSVTPPPYFPNTPVTRKDWARHYDTASQMDIEAGRLLRELEEDGLTTNTAVFFFSDHGVGLPRSKRWNYDAGLRVPLVVRWPGVTKARSRNEELVSLMDLAPTMLTLLGLKVPDYMQGRVFLGPDKQPEPRYLFATRDRVDETVHMVRSVRDRQFKYIKNGFPERPYTLASAYADENPTMMEMRKMHEDGTLTGPATLLFQPRKPEEELYDTVADPHEINNLSGEPEHKARLEEMRKVLVQWQDEIGDKGRQAEPEDERSRAANERRRRSEK